MLARNSYQIRVLLACIRFLGECLCPRCLAKKANASQMGTPTDMWIRKVHTRINDRAYQAAIKKARKYIFHGKSLSSKKVEDLLKGTSLVPTRVSSNLVQKNVSTNSPCRMLFPSVFLTRRNSSTSSSYSLLISFTKSNWVFGRRSSRIYFASYMLMQVRQSQS